VSRHAAIQEARHGFNRIRGQLFSAVEACDLPIKQENALKGLIRELTYNAQSNVEGALRGEQ
jgi:hypothetical protein